MTAVTTLGNPHHPAQQSDAFPIFLLQQMGMEDLHFLCL